MSTAVGASPTMTASRTDTPANPSRPHTGQNEDPSAPPLPINVPTAHVAGVSSVTWTPAPATIACQLVVVLTASEVENTPEVSSDCGASSNLLPGVDRRAG
jgi:hypothetical protein